MKRSFFALAITVPILSGCGVISVPEASRPSEPLKIGAAFDLSEDVSSLDAPAARGAILAVEEINASGGLLGSPVKLILKNPGYDMDKTTQMADELLQEGASGVVGFSDSQSVQAFELPLQETASPFITVGASSPKLPGQLNSGQSLFLACFGSNAQAALAAEYAVPSFGSKAVVIYDNGEDDPKLLVRYFKKRFEELGGQIQGSYYYLGKNPTITKLIRLLKESKVKPDFIYLAAKPENSASIVIQLRSAGIKEPIIGNDGLDTSDISHGSPSLIGNVSYTTHAFISRANESQKVRKFIDAYNKKYGIDPENAFPALGYDSVNLLAEAFKRAGNSDPQNLTNALENIDKFDGITGEVSYGARTRIPKKPVSLITVVDGEPKLVKSAVPEKVPMP